MKPLTLGEEANLLSAAAEQLRVADRIGKLEHGHVVEPGNLHPWVVGLGERVLTALLTSPSAARMCRHLGRRGPEQMFGEFVRIGVPPGEPARLFLYCRDCLIEFRARIRFGPIDDSTCDRCGIYTRRGLVLGALPIGPLLLTYGVCRSCADDFGITRKEAAS